MHARQNAFRAPVVKVFFPFASGIIYQYYFDFSPPRLIFLLCTTSLLFLTTQFLLPSFRKFKYPFVSALFLLSLFFFTGMWIYNERDVIEDPQWYGKEPQPVTALIIEEPLSEKARSFKTIASVWQLQRNRWKKKNGFVILYFAKDTFALTLSYGSAMITTKTLLRIKGALNPGAFDYSEWCRRNEITHQVFLKHGDYKQITSPHKSSFKKFLFSATNKTINIIRTYIPGKTEQGLAEALLIGYKNDLDKSIVQAYSSTGTVHVIAISGLHLGLIYAVLLVLLKPLRKFKRGMIWIGLITISCLWIFSLLAGAQASVVRSAVMFTCLAAGQMISRKSSIYNTLACSAFMLLIYKPAWLWDVGFQLSYAAVLSILLFQKPISNWFCFKYYLSEKVWELISVTLAAQVLTLPLIMFYFHQVPNLFLPANLIAVPLSSVILFAELLLCAVSVFTVLAAPLGLAISFMIRFMNEFIETLDRLPIAITPAPVSLETTIIIYVCLLLITAWFFSKNIAYLISCMMVLSLYFVLVKNMCNKKKAGFTVYHNTDDVLIDLFSGNHGIHLGSATSKKADSVLKKSRFYLHLPQHFEYRKLSTSAFSIGAIKMLILDSLPVRIPTGKTVNYLIITKNAKAEAVINGCDIRFVIADASNSFFNRKKLRQLCYKHKIPFYDVAESGAFAGIWR